jgi:hypothetical protein
MPKIPAPDNFTDQNAPGGEQPDSQFNADLAHMTARYNEASVTEAHAGLLDKLKSILHEPGTGYLNLQGKNAVSSFDTVKDALGQLPKQISDSLSNDQQRAMFDKVAGSTLSAAVSQVQRHAARQMESYEADASQARAAAAADSTVCAYNPAPGADNSFYRQALLTQKIELEKQAALRGLTEPALRDHYVQFGPDGKSGLACTYSNVITGLLNNDQAQAAQSYFDRVKDALPESMRGTLGQYVEAALHKHEGMNAALHAQAQSPEAGKQHEILDGLLADGKISETSHAIARQALHAQDASIKAQQADNDKQVLARVWELKHNAPHPALTGLTAADYAYLKSRGLDKNAQAILDGHPAQDDPQRFNDLHRLSVDDPVKFAQTNLLADSGHLSRAHLKYLQGVQDAINQQDTKALAPVRALRIVLNDLIRH